MAEGYFCAIGQGYKGRHEIDLKGKYVVPGFMDGHLHLESSVVTVLFQFLQIRTRLPMCLEQ